MPQHVPPRFPNLAAAIAIDGRPKYLIAAEAGCTPNIISGVLSGRVDPTPAVRERMASALGRDPGDLFVTAGDYAARRVAETRAAQGLPHRPTDDVLDVAASIANFGGSAA